LRLRVETLYAYVLTGGPVMDDANLEIVIVQATADALTPALRAKRDTFYAATFRGGNDPARYWAPPQKHYFLMRGEQLIGHVGVYRREITHAGRRYAVAGIAKVGLIPTERGGGLGSRLMQYVQDDLRTQATDDLGLLVTGENRLGFYGRLGWQRVVGPVIYDYAGTPRTETFPVLLLGLRLTAAAHTAWQEEPIDLAGPFW